MEDQNYQDENEFNEYEETSDTNVSEEPTELNEFKSHDLQFNGVPLDYFKINIVNWILTLLTLGLYYPWARAKRLKYVYGHIELNEENFHFSGTGREMFIGFLKVIGIYLAIVGITILSIDVFQSPILMLLVYAIIIAVIPLAIHGSFKYRMSRTSYRGIRFGYRGSRKELTLNFYKYIFLTIITLGIYSSWLAMNVRRYTHSHIRYGDVEFHNNSRGGEFFKIYIVGYILSFLTLGIYFFWWERDFYNYYVNSISITKDDKEIICYAETTGEGFFKLHVGNFFIILFTLGLGSPWADVRTYRYLINNVKLIGNINLDTIHQTEDEYTNALGDDALDFFDLEII